MERIVVCFVLILRSTISIFLSLSKMTLRLFKCVLSSVCPRSRPPSSLSLTLFIWLFSPCTQLLPAVVFSLSLSLSLSPSLWPSSSIGQARQLVVASLGPAASCVAYMTRKADTWRRPDETYRFCQQAPAIESPRWQTEQPHSSGFQHESDGMSIAFKVRSRKERKKRKKEKYLLLFSIPLSY